MACTSELLILYLYFLYKKHGGNVKDTDTIEDVAKFIKDEGFTKPLVAYIAGRFVEDMPEGTVFGHAASIIEGGSGKPSTKMALLRDSGCHVLENFNDLISELQMVFE